MSRQKFFSSRFHYTFGPHPPTLTVAPGTALQVVCPDSDNELADGTLLTPEQRQRDETSPLMEGNPMAGPIAVEGAEVGDCLAVRIEAVHLDRRKGQTLLAPAHGLLPMDLLSRPDGSRPADEIPRHLYEWDIDAEAGVATLVNRLGTDPITVKLDPFVGCLGVCPKWAQSISTLYAGSFGGNMDLPAVRPGVTVYLPVYRSGGLLMMGDIHAAQGHGEIIGGAIETSGKIDCTIELIKGRPIDSPRLCEASRIMALASDGDLRGAVQQAYAHLLNWLSDELAMNRWDAYHLMSQTASIMTGNLLVPPYIVGASIPIDALPASTRKKVDAWPE